MRWDARLSLDEAGEQAALFGDHAEQVVGRDDSDEIAVRSDDRPHVARPESRRSSTSLSGCSTGRFLAPDHLADRAHELGERAHLEFAHHARAMELYGALAHA